MSRESDRDRERHREINTIFYLHIPQISSVMLNLVRRASCLFDLGKAAKIKSMSQQQKWQEALGTRLHLISMTVLGFGCRWMVQLVEHLTGIQRSFNCLINRQNICLRLENNYFGRNMHKKRSDRE